ncbi:unnamed protein product, partial [Choristocarpus tenellus]
MAALYGYEISGGDAGLLEKAYDLARDVAGARHDLPIAVSASRIALASGFVYSIKMRGAEQAARFVLQHTLPRLISSLQRYWAKGLQSYWAEDLDQEKEWEDCMLSLLEVLSSVLLLPKIGINAMDLLDQSNSGVAKALGHYCALWPDTLMEYPDVGKECVQRFLPSLSVGEFQLAMTRLGLNNRTLEDKDLMKAWPFVAGGKNVNK